MKLYVDDIREVPDDSWTLVRTINQAIHLLHMFALDITEISLDHDISHEVRIDGVYRPFPSPESFKAVAYYIGVRYSDTHAPKMTIHSANPQGSEDIKSILKMYGIDSELKPMGEAYRPK